MTAQMILTAPKAILEDEKHALSSPAYPQGLCHMETSNDGQAAPPIRRSS